jgi:hypothetical protein
VVRASDDLRVTVGCSDITGSGSAGKLFLRSLVLVLRSESALRILVKVVSKDVVGYAVEISLSVG